MRGDNGWWPLSEPQTGFLMLVVGLVLILNPLYLGYINVGQWGYGYETKPVTVEEGRIAVDGQWPPAESFDNIACSGFSQSYECAYQYARFADTDYPVTVPVELNPFQGPRYVYQYGTNGSGGQYYRRSVEDTDTGQIIRLEPVSPTAVLENVSVTPSRLSLPARWALLTGTVQTPRPLPGANRIIETGDGFAVLKRTRTPEFGVDFAWVMTAASGLLVGLGLLRAGYRSLAGAD